MGVRDEVADDVERIFREEEGYVRGYRFVHHVLVGERGGKPISEKIVRDVMRERGLTVIYRKKERRYSSYAGETDAGAPNIPLDEKSGRHDFRADAPNRKGRSPDKAACEGFFGRPKYKFFHSRDWSGVGAEEFMMRLDAWVRFYSDGRLKAFRRTGGRSTTRSTTVESASG